MRDPSAGSTARGEGRPRLSRERFLTGAVVLIALLALGLRLFCMDCYGLWYDEVASVEIARRGPWAVLTDRFGGMLVQTPLHYLTVWLTLLPFDPASSSVIVRLPSALAGALAVPVVYGLGREMFGRVGRGAGLLAALLLALSPLHIGHSQDVRPYTQLVLFTALSVYSLLRAERTGSARWWAAFAASTVTALLTSYFALSLFLPALLPYLAWVVYRAWKERSTRNARAPLLSTLVVMAAAGLAALDALRVERAAPDLSLLTPKLLFDQLVLLPTRLAAFGLGGAEEQAAQWLLFALAVVGVVWAAARGHLRGTAIPLLMVAVPALLLALFRTTNQVFQRYAIFALPFYLLAAGAGVAALWHLLPTAYRSLRASVRGVAGAAGAALLILFALGAYLYFSPTEHRRFSYLPDYRGAARYLSEVGRPDDLIVLVDEPALGMEVMRLYWRGSPPAPTFDARDPRLFSQRPGGDVYWVVSFFQNNPEFLRDLPSGDPRWESAASFERITVLRERDVGDIAAGLERLAARMREKLPDFQPVRTLEGVLLQARGDAAGAAEQYRLAGPYYPQLGAEFYGSAEGFLARGEQDKAWREAITSLFMHPGDPRIHDLLARMLASGGYTAESALEAEVAAALSGSK